jgi:hypothetical protein
MIVWNINCKGHNLFQGSADNLLTMCPPNPTDMLLIRNLIILMTETNIITMLEFVIHNVFVIFWWMCFSIDSKVSFLRGPHCQFGGVDQSIKQT